MPSDVTKVEYGRSALTVSGSLSVRTRPGTEARTIDAVIVDPCQVPLTAPACALTDRSDGVLMAAADSRHLDPSGRRVDAGFQKPPPNTFGSAPASAMSPTGNARRSRPGISGFWHSPFAAIRAEASNAM
jgi:hypothetical protein